MRFLSPTAQTLIGLGLVALMLTTRFHHFGDVLHLPDASWAVFFLAGFYLAAPWLGVFLVLAVAIDVAAIGWLGVSDYCLTPAYAALQLAHLALWMGGRLAKRARQDALGLLHIGGLAVIATVMAFIISNGSFYWFGGRVGAPNWSEFAQTFIDYLPGFTVATLFYLALAALIHAVLTARRRPLPYA
ncbi:MAG: hypothetical protein NZ524_03440 [Thiobacillaceae bacterium]|nr:hypothetical protein [Thiobacillaceae bacterium]